MKQKTSSAHPLQWRLLRAMVGTEHLGYKFFLFLMAFYTEKTFFSSGKVSGDKNENKTLIENRLALTCSDGRASRVAAVAGRHRQEEGRCFL